MRKMVNLENGNILEVVEHIMLKNLWEYYVINAETNEANVKLCLVLGYEQEIGDVYLPEIMPFVLSKKEVNPTTEIFPAHGYEWA